MTVSPGQMATVEVLASKVEMTARNLRAKNLEHKHLFEAAEYMRTGSIPIPLDSTTTYVNILRGNLLLSDGSRRALCPEEHGSNKPEVVVTVRLNEYGDEPEDCECMYINGKEIVQYISPDGDDMKDHIVECGITTAETLGVGLTIVGKSENGVDDQGVSLDTDIELFYDFADLHKARQWRAYIATGSDVGASNAAQD